MNLKLTDLEPSFVRHEYRGEHLYYVEVSTLAEAHGVEFLDPVELNGRGGTVICWFRGRVPDCLEPGPGRWYVSGSDFTNLTLDPSVDLSCGNKYPGRWHGWVRNGEVT